LEESLIHHPAVKGLGRSVELGRVFEDALGVNKPIFCNFDVGGCKLQARRGLAQFLV
jgi:hypothetical protein